MQQQERLHALDAVRAFALLLGIFFHAAMSFINVEVESLHWAISDSSQSTILMVFVGMSHIFRMSLFFFIAGFFAHLVYHRKGPQEFARNRAIRIGVPFVLGWCVIAPLLRVVWQWGQAKSGTAPPLTLWPEVAAWTAGQVNLTHLWFLYYLILIYVLVVGLRHVLIERVDLSGIMRKRVDSLVARSMDRRWAPLVFAAPIAITAIFVPSWNAAKGMPTPDRSLIPELVPLVGYGTVFAAGWVFHRTPELFATIRLRMMSWLWLIIAAFAATGALGSWLAMSTETEMGFVPALVRFSTAMAATTLMWYINFAIVGFALKRFASPSRTTRYVADASYWLYLAHLPIVAALQVWVADWPLHWTVKYPFIVCSAFALLFLSYHFFVRYSFVGAVLNGRKYRNSPETHGRAPVGINRI